MAEAAPTPAECNSLGGTKVTAAQVMASPSVTHSNYVPAQLHRQLEFMDFNKDGHMVLGCSDLTGRYWTGSLWYYRDPSEAPSVEKALTGVDCNSGVVDGRFFGDKSKHMLVALDDGSVEHISLAFSDEGSVATPDGAPPPHPTSFFYLDRMASVVEHDDIITGMDLMSDGRRLVTCSHDGTVNCLDVDTLRLERRLIVSHNDLITSVSASKVNPRLIATSDDSRVIAWDIDDNRENGCFCWQACASDWPTAVEWVTGSEHHLLVGHQSGRVVLYDARQTSTSVATVRALDRQVRQLKCSLRSPLSFAVSGDSNRLQIVNIEHGFSGLTPRVDNCKHDDFIGGMAWHPETNVLYSCGWDHKVLAHKV